MLDPDYNNRKENEHSILLKLIKQLHRSADTRAEALDNQRISSERNSAHESQWQQWGRGRQEVHSREVSEFKAAMGVFSSWKFTWEWAWIKVSAGWPKSLQKKDGKHQFQTWGSCNQRAERESEGGWSGGERGGKGGDESEGLSSLHPPPRICGGWGRSALQFKKWHLEWEKTKSLVIKQIKQFLFVYSGHPCFCELQGTEFSPSLSSFFFSHHARTFCNLSIKSEMTQTGSSDETMRFIWRPCMLHLRSYLSWLSVLVDKQQNNIQASPWLQLTTFQLRPNLVQSQDDLIALKRKHPNICGWPRGFASKKNFLVFKSFFFF